MTDNLTFDLNRITYVKMFELIENLSKGNIEQAYGDVAALVVSWPYNAPISADSILELSVEQGASLIQQAVSYINAEMEAAYDMSVPVFLHKWTTRRFLDFNKALRERDIQKVVALLPEVTIVKSPVSAVEGIKAVKAINTAYGNAIAAKN
jgi:hypothetical protein